LLEEVLDASIALLDADFGSVQLYDEATGTLTVVSQRGFTREFLDYFGRLHEGTAACGEAARLRERIIVEDVRTDPLFAPHVDVVSAAGYRAVQSTPMLGNRGQVLGVISTHFRHPHRPSERELRFVDLYARQAAAMIDRKRAEEARHELVRRLIAAQEDERRRISRDMHDDFGQQVSALRMKIEALKRDYRGHANLGVPLASLEAMVKQLDSDVDRIAWQLRPAALDDLGLGAALTSYVKGWSEHFDVSAELHVSGMEANRLTTERETALYRVMQEALNNVAKHAHARHVIIALQCWSDRVSLIVEDDGVGFDSERIVAAVDKQLGLVGMRERALLLGGTLDVESQPGRGTTVVARIPAESVQNFHPR